MNFTSVRTRANALHATGALVGAIAALTLAAHAPQAAAQTAPSAKPAAATPAAKTAAKPAAKPAAKAAAPAPAAAALPKAEGEQIAAAALTHYGDYACEFDQTVSVVPSPKNEGYVDLKFKKDTFTMKPVLSSTGALRLEDVNGRTLMLQIANKSMLMDTKVGQRMVDGCMHEKQREFMRTAGANQMPSLGIDPSKK